MTIFSRRKNIPKLNFCLFFPELSLPLFLGDSGSIFKIMNHSQYYVYILTNRSNKTLYIGFTNDLRRRVLEHKKKLVEGFTKKYYLNKLIYFEKYLEMADAQKRERQLKNWHRDWKLNLIKENNSDFQDLSEGWYDDIDKIN